MKKRLFIAAICSSVMAGGYSYGQQTWSKCATAELVNMQLANDPSFKAKFEANELATQQRAATILAEMDNAAFSKTTATKITIPLVFHVALTQAQIDIIGGTAGVYDRITSQIEVLNIDFNANNTDTVPTIFKPLKTGADFNFALAHTDPTGKATIGIEIKVMPSSFSGYGVGDKNLKRADAGGLDAWDYNKYVNVWITDITTSSSGEVLGYAYSPAVAPEPNLRGVVLDYLAFGKRKSSFQNFINNADRGRTAVHEFGHFFTLFHIWGNTPVGSGSCSDDDGVGDTPQQNDANQSVCPPFPKENCAKSTGGEMFMNYMDYVPDICMRMFSKGQVARMRSEFNQTGGSFSIQFHEGLTAWPTGVDEVAIQNAFEVTPNPSTGIFNFTFGQTAQPVKSIVITNQLGQVVKQIANADKSAKSVIVDMSGMNAGMYTAQCQYEDGIVTKKIVLQ